MTEGKLFKKLRKERGLSLQDVTTPRLSKSFISKFERGESQISLERFKELVGQLNITLEEFFYYEARESQTLATIKLKNQDYYFSASYLPFFKKLTNVMELKNNQEKITGYENFLKSLPPETSWGKHYERLGELLLEIETFNQENANLPKEERKNFDLEDFAEGFRKKSRPLVSYLFSVENWGIYELTLFRWSFFLMPIETSHSLLKTALDRTEELEFLAGMAQLQMDLIFGLFTAFANFGRLDWAQEALNLAQERLKNSGDLFNETYLLFFKGWNYFANGDKKMGEEKCQQALSIFKILDQPKMYEEMLPIYHFIKNRVDHPENGAMFL